MKLQLPDVLLYSSLTKAVIGKPLAILDTPNGQKIRRWLAEIENLSQWRVHWDTCFRTTLESLRETHRIKSMVWYGIKAESLAKVSWAQGYLKDSELLHSLKCPALQEACQPNGMKFPQPRAAQVSSLGRIEIPGNQQRGLPSHTQRESSAVLSLVEQANL
jgi:hypothetical protein